MNKKFLLASAALILTACSLPAWSKDSAQTPLQISERQLRDLSQAIHTARHEASGLVIECQRENAVEGGEIDFIGTDIIPIIPATAEGFGNQYLPPRPKYINLHMSNLNNAMPLVQDEINALKAPDADEAARVAQYITEMKSLYADAQKHLAALQPLTTALPYDQQNIASEATALSKSLEQIDKLKKEMYKSYKRDPDKGNGDAPQNKAD